MDFQDDRPRSHEDRRICALLLDCPFLAGRVDLSEGPYYVMGEIATFIRDGLLPDVEMDCVFAHFHKMAEGDLETQNLLVVGVLEMLRDSPQSIARARKELEGGPARPLFERVLKGWIVRGMH
jgi:hypothetical protein